MGLRKDIFPFSLWPPDTAISGSVFGDSIPVDHAIICLIEWGGVEINFEAAGNGIRSATVGIEIDKRSNISLFAKRIGRTIVVCGVQADVWYGNIRI